MISGDQYHFADPMATSIVGPSHFGFYDFDQMASPLHVIHFNDHLHGLDLTYLASLNTDDLIEAVYRDVPGLRDATIEEQNLLFGEIFSGIAKIATKVIPKIIKEAPKIAKVV